MVVIRTTTVLRAVPDAHRIGEFLDHAEDQGASAHTSIKDPRPAGSATTPVGPRAAKAISATDGAGRAPVPPDTELLQSCAGP